MNWQGHFNRARRSTGPVTVRKQEVGAIPHRFNAQGVTINGVWGVYERHDRLEKTRITELPGHYFVTVSNTVSSTPQLQRLSNTESNQLQPRYIGNQNGSGWKELAALGLLIGGAAIIGKALGDSKSTSSPDPKQAHRVFISHSWRYEDHFEDVKSLLNDAYGFEYFDHSVSSDDPIDAQLPNHLRSKIRDQMRSTSVVLVLAGMYVAHSDWIQEEIEMADEMDKPIIGVVPEENERVPKVVEEESDELVRADGNEILDAIKRRAT